MTAYVFGGISSPSCSNYALNKTVADNVKKYGNEASTIVNRNFYVCSKAFQMSRQWVTW